MTLIKFSREIADAVSAAARGYNNNIIAVCVKCERRVFSSRETFFLTRADRLAGR